MAHPGYAGSASTSRGTSPVEDKVVEAVISQPWSDQDLARDDLHL